MPLSVSGNDNGREAAIRRAGIYAYEQCLSRAGGDEEKARSGVSCVVGLNWRHPTHHSLSGRVHP